MFKLYLKLSIVFVFLSSSTFLFAQSVGINTTAANPSTNAILDLNTGNTGILGFIIPHVTLAASISQFNPPIIGAATASDVGMLVYNNVATNQPIGYYYWNGASWVALGGAGGGPAGSGTINYIARWTAANSLGIGVSQDNGVAAGISAAVITPKSLLDVNGGVGIGTYAGTNAAPANGMIVSGQVGVGTSSPNVSAALDLTDTTQGFLTPRLATAAITGMAAPAVGLIVYNITTNCFEYNYTGTPAGWVTLGCACLSAPTATGPIGSITPSTNMVCISQTGQTFSITPVPNATSYTWTVPSMVGNWYGQGGSSITVGTYTNTGTGNFTVTANNACGASSPASVYTLYVSSAAPTATSLTAATYSFCSPTTDLITINGLSNGVQYVWSASSNGICSAAVIAAANAANGGLGANSLTLSGGLGGSGTVSVTITNGCGSVTVTTAAITYYNGNGTITLDNAVNGPENYFNPSFQITTTNNNEIVLVMMNGLNNTTFSGSVSVTGGNASAVSQVDAQNLLCSGDYVSNTIFAFVANTAATYTINGLNNYIYSTNIAAVALEGFCGTPTIAANVSAPTYNSNTSCTQGILNLTNTISPTIANSYVVANFYGYNAYAINGNVTWTSPSNNIIATDNNNGNYSDGSIDGYADPATGLVTFTFQDCYNFFGCNPNIWMGGMDCVYVHN